MIAINRKEKIFKIIEKLEEEQKLEEKIVLAMRTAKLVENSLEINKDNYEGIIAEIKESIKYKVAIFGENKLYLNVLNEILNNKRAKITGIYDFVDCEKESIYGKIIPIKDLKENEVDYIINLKNANTSNTILNFLFYLSFFHDYEFCNGYYNFLDSKDKIKGVMVGTSSHEMAILNKNLKYEMANLAVSLQDIFYGKKMIEHALNIDENKKIEYCIIGMFHQSFVYDVSSHSMSSFSSRVNMYYRVTKDLHYFPQKKKLEMEYERFENIAKNIFKENYDKILYEKLKEKNEAGINYLRSKLYDRSILSEKEKEEEESGIKNYLELYNEKTIEENLNLMKELLSKLRENNIRTIILVCPMAKIWRELSMKNPITRNIFNESIEKLKQEYEFELYDYFDREEFTDSYFYNASHLNFKGAEKFTKMFAADSGIELKE